MRKYHKTLLLAISFLFVALSVTARSYYNSFGVRVGNGVYRTVGLSYQQRLLKDFSVEGIVQTDFGKNTTIHGLFEYHRPIITKRLNYYIGAGIMSGKEMVSHFDSLNNFQTGIFGADLIAGVELTLLRFTISLDYKPNFNIVGREKWYSDQVGVSVRAVIWNGKKFKKKQRQKKRVKYRDHRDERMEERTKNAVIKG